RFQIPQGAVQRVSRGACGQQLLNLLAIQTFLRLDRFDLCQNGGNSLIVTPGRNRLAATRVFPVGDGHHDNLRFRATATRNAKRLLERPDFFASVDLQGGELQIRERRSEDRNWNSSVATLGMQWTRSGIMKITRNIGML